MTTMTALHKWLYICYKVNKDKSKFKITDMLKQCFLISSSIFSKIKWKIPKVVNNPIKNVCYLI